MQRGMPGGARCLLKVLLPPLRSLLPFLQQPHSPTRVGPKKSGMPGENGAIHKHQDPAHRVGLLPMQLPPPQFARLLHRDWKCDWGCLGRLVILGELDVWECRASAALDAHKPVLGQPACVCGGEWCTYLEPSAAISLSSAAAQQEQIRLSHLCGQQRGGGAGAGCQKGEEELRYFFLDDKPCHETADRLHDEAQPAAEAFEQGTMCDRQQLLHMTARGWPLCPLQGCVAASAYVQTCVDVLLGYPWVVAKREVLHMCIDHPRMQSDEQCQRCVLQSYKRFRMTPEMCDRSDQLLQQPGGRRQWSTVQLAAVGSDSLPSSLPRGSALPRARGTVTGSADLGLPHAWGPAWPLQVVFSIMMPWWGWPCRGVRVGEALQPGPGYRIRRKSAPALSTESSSALSLDEPGLDDDSGVRGVAACRDSDMAMPAAPTAEPGGADDNPPLAPPSDGAAEAETLTRAECERLLNFTIKRAEGQECLLACSWVGSKGTYRWQVRSKPCLNGNETRTAGDSLAGWLRKHATAIDDIEETHIALQEHLERVRAHEGALARAALLGRLTRRMEARGGQITTALSTGVGL